MEKLSELTNLIEYGDYKKITELFNKNNEKQTNQDYVRKVVLGYRKVKSEQAQEIQRIALKFLQAKAAINELAAI